MISVNPTADTRPFGRRTECTRQQLCFARKGKVDGGAARRPPRPLAQPSKPPRPFRRHHRLDYNVATNSVCLSQIGQRKMRLQALPPLTSGLRSHQRIFGASRPASVDSEAGVDRLAADVPPGCHRTAVEVAGEHFAIEEVGRSSLRPCGRSAVSLALRVALYSDSSFLERRREHAEPFLNWVPQHGNTDATPWVASPFHRQQPLAQMPPWETDRRSSKSSPLRRHRVLGRFAWLDLVGPPTGQPCSTIRSANVQLCKGARINRAARRRAGAPR
jgi:hypothetical protein